jgi:3-oxoacyl-[acyl-carrier-protein] synthase-3
LRIDDFGSRIENHRDRQSESRNQKSEMSTYSAIITGTGSYVPEKCLTNDDLSKMVETNDEWIVQRTGMRERRIVGEGESTATLALRASQKALEAAGISAGDLDLIICATITPDMVTPSSACFVAQGLGLTSTPAFDLGAACSGFLYAMSTATAFIKSGLYRNVLVIGAESLSRITDYTDRGTCILFGDGAGAAVMTRGTDPKKGVLYSSLHSDGNGWELLNCPAGSRNPVNQALIDARGQFLKMKGREVYKFAVTRFEEMIEDAIRKTELSKEDISLLIPHQVNQRIIDSAMAKLHIPPEKAFINIEKYGNTSAASIPIALDEAVRAGKVKAGDNIVFVAFGAGLTWANAVVRM